MLNTISLFFALLALGANAVVVLAVLGRVLRRVPTVARIRADAVDQIRDSALWLAAVPAAVATAGSLYYSEIVGFPPCILCWVQRGFMYPLAIALPLAAWRAFWGLRIWAQGAALLGAAVSGWHLLIERYPGLEGAAVCDPTNPCSLVWVREFGFVTIPYMALSAFLLVAVLLSVRPPAATPTTPEDPELVSSERS